MMTYWDLSKKDRADLTEEEMERYQKIELMERGLKQPTEPTYEPEIKEPEPEKVRIYKIKASEYRDINIAFMTEQDAINALDSGACEIEEGYGDPCAHLSPFINPEIVSIDVATARSYESHKTQLKEAMRIKDANEELRKEYEKECDDIRKALIGIQSDWYKQQAKKIHLMGIVAKFVEFVAIAGDPSIAAKFLRKSHSKEDIAEANEWLAAEIPESGGDE